MVYQDSTHLSVIIADHPSILSLLNRVGIFLGVGNATVRQAAEAGNIDSDLLMTLINTYLNKDYFPENELLGFPILGICDYLTRTNNFYMKVQLPNIVSHFRIFVERSSAEDNNLKMLFDFFLSLEKDLRAELEDYNELLSVIVDSESTDAESLSAKMTTFASERLYPASDSLNDLINLFIIHLKGSYDANLCHAVINALISLSNDMRQNNRIFDRILAPSVKCSNL